MENFIEDKIFLNSFWKKVVKMKNCWNWVACKGQDGYGHLSVNGKNFRAHRISYMISNGEIPEGFQIDHLCRNTSCVNPKHLEAVTQRENIMRGFGITAQNLRKIYCINNHKFTNGNTWFYKEKGAIRRVCKACTKIKTRNYLERKKRG